VLGIDDWYEEKYYDIFDLLIQHETPKNILVSRELHRFTYSYKKTWKILNVPYVVKLSHKIFQLRYNNEFVMGVIQDDVLNDSTICFLCDTINYSTANSLMFKLPVLTTF
jgi:hypothetical protein